MREKALYCNKTIGFLRPDWGALANKCSFAEDYPKSKGPEQGRQCTEQTSPVSSFSSVDFPAPLGPTRATRVSRSIPNSRLL